MNFYNEQVSPRGMAERLAGYISDPSTIRVRVMDHFGRAPSLDECRKIREAVEQREANARWLKRGASEQFRCGHTRDASNVIVRDDGRETCKTCRRALEAKSAAEYRARERERAEQSKAAKMMEAAEQAATNIRAFWLEPGRPRLSGETLEVIARAFGLSVGELVGDNRHRHYVDARAVAVMVFLQSGYSLPWIAKKLNRSCHSSIINLRDTWDIRCRRNPSLLAVYKAVVGE